MWSAFWAVLNFLTALPSLIKSIKDLIKQMKVDAMKKKESARKQKADQIATDIKNAQEAGDVEKQTDALSSAVDDFNS